MEENYHSNNFDPKKIYEIGILKCKENIPQIIINLIVAGLIWAFGILVFIPIADLISNPNLFGLTPLKPIISIIVALALIYVLLKVIRDFGELMDGIADIVAVKLAGDRVNEEKLNKYRRGFRGLAYLLVAIVGYLFFLPILASITAVIAGILLIILVIWAVYVIINLGDIFSDEIEEGIRLTISKLEEIEKARKKDNEDKEVKQ